MEDKGNLKPVLLKVGVALAISFAGFIYSRFKIRKQRPTLPPPSRISSDQEIKVEFGRREGYKLENQTINTSTSSNVILFAADEYEEMYVPKVNVDDSGFGLSPSSRHSGELLLPEFQELVKEFDFSPSNVGFSPRKNVETPRSDVETPIAFRNIEKDDYEQEIRHLKNKVKMLRESERNLEVQLLEYYGLKEQETAVMELQNRLKINNMEAKLFTLKIESLQADKRRLESQVSDHAKSMADLEAARAKIKLLKKKLRYEVEQNRGQILTLQQRVAKLQDQECKMAESNGDVCTDVQKIIDLESEIDELKKSNMILQVEKSDLTRRLEATQVLANSILEVPETEALNEEKDHLTRENEELRKEIEQLQVHRCTDVEELVYLRWINACLRYELRNYQPPPGKTAAGDLSKTLSPKSEDKAKKLILEYASTEGIEGKNINIMDFDSDQWSSSQASFRTDPGDLDDSLVDLPAVTTKNPKKIKFMSKFRKLLKGKGKDSKPNQVLSAEKCGSVEDSDSPRYSSSNSTGTNASKAEGHGVGYATPSQSSSRYSLDFHRLSSQKEEDPKTEDLVRRNSDVGFNNRRFGLGSDGACNSPFKTRGQDVESLEKELVKYAEVFKGSRGAKHPRRKSCSMDSF